MKFIGSVVLSGLLFTAPATALESIDVCSNEKEVRDAKNEFLRLSDLRKVDISKVSKAVFKAAAANYVAVAEACYLEKYGQKSSSHPIDEGGVWFDSVPGSDEFVTFGTKWGPDSPFAGGQDVPGPGTPGGLVTYSFMPDGVDNSAESATANVALSSLPTYSACFITEIENAFDAWAAIADITFSEVTDDGLPFNTGVAGDIRIGSHTFDGASGTLAHGFFPPPNGNTAAGDIHFDSEENWDCFDNGSTFDIGIVGIHEIGHALGLGHEGTDTAIMNPFYNPVVDVPLVDDIEAMESIYGGLVSGSVECDIEMTDSSYSGTEVATIAVMSISNTTGGFVNTEFKVWAVDPSGIPYPFFTVGAEGDLSLPAGFFTDLAETDIALFPANSEVSGTWGVGCRVENSTTGEDFGADLAPFEINP